MMPVQNMFINNMIPSDKKNWTRLIQFVRMEYFRLEFRLTMNGKTHHETIRNNTLNQIESLAKRFCHADALPFKKYFSAEEFAETLKNLALKGKNRVYPPVVTL